MATKKKSTAKTAAAAKPKAKGSWTDTLKAALDKKNAKPGWPAEDTAKSHSKQSAAHGKLGRRNPPR